MILCGNFFFEDFNSGRYYENQMTEIEVVNHNIIFKSIQVVYQSAPLTPGCHVSGIMLQQDDIALSHHHF